MMNPLCLNHKVTDPSSRGLFDRMERYADVGCVLKVNVDCEACKMKLYEVLRSISGVYSVTIDAEEGLAKISGEVDPNILLRAVGTSGKHAELKWVQLKSPVVPNRSQHYRDDMDKPYGPYSISYGQYHGYGRAIEQPHWGRRALPEAEGGLRCDTHSRYCLPPLPEYSYNYSSISVYPPPQGAHYS
ncbi:hypothetical protein RHMOL_Rhmol04G0014500 [Rhododendron molle]|uniref:Uncharacterized protein n=1 Tax=Rhododendron molle TaxID=49168 RepID=A0ACC0NWZ7_RHOML|nr:hypothetical protein RHMOL_Rhmol04G0014500 [Rhododendron molle]